jgi:hypothetical protein
MATLTGFLQDNEGSYIEKDAEAVLDYTIDWSPWLPSGDTIVTSNFTVEALAGDTDALAKVTQSNNNTLAIVKISNGTAGKIYRVYNQITTVAGLTDRRYFRIKVKNRTV